MRSKAVIEREAAEDYLYEVINAYSGLSIYELAKKLGWSTGKVYDIVKSLENSELITTQKVEENGRTKKRVYPTAWKDLLPKDVKENL